MSQNHTLNWFGAKGGGAIFRIILGEYLIFEFYCTFIKESQNFSLFQGSQGGGLDPDLGAKGGLFPPPPNSMYAQKTKYVHILLLHFDFWKTETEETHGFTYTLLVPAGAVFSLLMSGIYCSLQKRILHTEAK